MNVVDMYKRDAQQKTLCGVYFMYCHLAGRVKIGRTKNLEVRFSALFTACPGPLRLLGFIHATDSEMVEKRIHTQFQHLYSGHGEWFYARKELLSFVDQHSSKVDTSNFSYTKGRKAALFPARPLQDSFLDVG